MPRRNPFTILSVSRVTTDCEDSSTPSITNGAYCHFEEDLTSSPHNTIRIQANMKSNLRSQLLLELLLLPSIAAQSCSQTTVYEQPVSINTEIETNTTFTPVPGYAMTISNAPTSIDTLTTLMMTGSNAYPASASASEVGSTNAGTSFYLVGLPRWPRQKRQAGFSYVGSDGTMTTDCTNAPIYSLVNGQLFAVQSGITYQFSAQLGLSYQRFVPTVVPGPITTTFSFAASNVLQWTNAQFFNGEASFCSMANGTVYAVFTEGGQPFGCFYIALNLYSQSSCAANTNTVIGAITSGCCLWSWMMLILVAAVSPSVVYPITGPTGPQGECFLELLMLC